MVDKGSSLLIKLEEWALLVSDLHPNQGDLIPEELEHPLGGWTD